MSTTKKRMALTLPRELETALADLADATGRPGASLAVDLLTEMVPQMHDIAKITRLAKAGQATAAKRAFSHMVGNAMAEAVTASQPDLFTKKRLKK
jgi:predicted DNA-binding protein